MTETENVHPLEILLVEDAAGDVELTLEGLEEARIANHVSIVSNGEDALTHLERSRGGDETRPDLILLDLNLPRMDGTEVLKNLKADPEFRRIPVIVLTSSKAADSIVEAYDLYANAYVTKPVGGEEFMDAVRSISDYWFTIVRLPSR